MATPIGVDVVTAISRRFILPDIADNVYNSNPAFFRLNKMNKKMVQGGTQIELPVMYSRFAAGGWYTGFDALNVSPSDTVKNAAFDWKQGYVPVTVDGRTLVRADSPQAVARFLSFYFGQAEMELAEIIGSALWATNPPTNQPDSIPVAVDNGTLAATYGGLTRSSNTFWNGQIDNATTTLSFAAMQTMFGNATFGGRHPTIIITDQHEYNTFIGLFSGTTYFERGPAGYDEVLAQGGWTNALFNNIPCVVDSHVPTGLGAAGAGTHSMYFLNENFIYLIVAQGVDFKLEDFITPVNQDAMVSKLYWMGDLCMNNLQTQGAFWDLS
jgi:hypothetical protein